jgi:hypothetical protein
MEVPAMSTKVKVIATTLVLGIAAFMSSQAIWPSPPGGPMPTGAQLPMLILLSLIEALMFGLGIAFLAFGFPTVSRMTKAVGVSTIPVFLSIAWQLVSWWPHSNFHRVAGGNFDVLIAIDYGFHLPLIISTLIIARFFIAALRRTAATAAPEPVGGLDSGRVSSARA